jgi:O-acetyl-ADP-ribose deacetylase
MLSDKYTVSLDTLWKMKASQRKVIQNRVLKVNAPVQPANPYHIQANHQSLDTTTTLTTIFEQFETSIVRDNLNTVAQCKLKGGTTFYIAHDSVINFNGDGIVNAANPGCIGGGGIDGVINRHGGEDIVRARFQLPLIDAVGNRCNTGDAKVTIGGKLQCKYVIHAVGPRCGLDDDHHDDLGLLENAYANALKRAKELHMETVAFCIISAGIYRGSCPLKSVIKTGMGSISRNVYPGLKSVYFCGFTDDERLELNNIMFDML